MDRVNFRDLAGMRFFPLAPEYSPVRRLRARVQALALLASLAMFIMFEGILAVNVPVLTADESGTLTVTPAYANVGKTITVVVDDVSPTTTVLYTSEATDFTGNPYSMPAGSPGQQHIFRVKNGPVADMNGDGQLNSSDIVTNLPNVVINWLNTQNGTFSVTQFLTTVSPTSFSVTYRQDVVDTTTVAVRSSADIEGFVMTLQETGQSTDIYTATLVTGTATSTTNIASPTAATRPVIKVVDAGILTIEYADTKPLTVVSDAVIIDTTPPVLTVQQIPHGATTSNGQNWVSVDVVDDRSGINLSDITLTVDQDRDGTFGETGEVLSPSTDFSSSINGGWAAFAKLTGMSDGKVDWFASATDIAGNAARTDSGTAEGNQNHTFEIDTVPPQVDDVLLGDDYEDEKDRAITNQPNRIRVNFSEPVDPDTVVPGRFLFGSLPAESAVVYQDLPSAVFLTYEDLPSIAEPMQVLAGAVTDLLGLNSERIVYQVEDRLGPTLEVIFDTVITRDKVTIMSRSPEELATAPTVEINGVTFGAMTPTGAPREWSIEVDDDLLTGAADGDGVKNVEIAGFDRIGNRAHGGVRREEPSWPANAHLFELDRIIKLPTILPAPNDLVKVVNPVITVSYAEEAAEYPGDTHGSVTVITAKLDGFDVTALMEATTAGSWTFQPGSLESGAHEFVIQSRDDAGNIHATPVLRFTVEPPATPTPEPTLAPTPEPTEVVILDPGATPPPDLVGTPIPTPTVEPVETTVVPEPTVVPEATVAPETTVEPTVAPTPDPDASPTPVPTPDPDATATTEPEVDVEATVQAIRDNDGSNGSVDLSGDEAAGYTVYGCGLPTAHSGVAGGDYTLIGLGMVGLVVLARRRRPGSGEDDDDGGTSSRPQRRDLTVYVRSSGDSESSSE